MSHRPVRIPRVRAPIPAAIAVCLLALGCAAPRDAPAPGDAPAPPAYREAQLALAREDFAGAARALRRFLAADPRHPLVPRARYTLGTLLLREHRTAEARRELETVPAGTGDRVLVEHARLRIGDTYLAEEAFSRAEQVYRELAGGACDAVRPEALFKLGLSLQREGRWAEARRAYEDLRETFPAHPRAGEALERLAPGDAFAVQVGAFRSRRNADALARALRRKAFAPRVTGERRSGRTLWVVRAGRFRARRDAEALRDRIRGALPRDGAGAVVVP